MPKPIIHVGLAAISTHPRGGELVRVSAVIGDRVFDRNLYHLECAIPKMYEKSPEVWEASQVNPQDPQETFDEFLNWLHSDYRSTFVGVGSYLDFTKILNGFFQHTGRNPFGDRLLDVDTWVACLQGDKFLTRKWWKEFQRPESVGGSLDPIEIAKNRLFAVTQGKMRQKPKASIKVPPPKKIQWRTWAQTEVARPTPPTPPTFHAEQLRALRNMVQQQVAPRFDYAGMENAAQAMAGAQAMQNGTGMWRVTEEGARVVTNE